MRYCLPICVVCVFHHIYGQFQGKIWFLEKKLQKVGIRSDPPWLGQFFLGGSPLNVRHPAPGRGCRVTYLYDNHHFPCIVAMHCTLNNITMVMVMLSPNAHV